MWTVHGRSYDYFRDACRVAFRLAYQTNSTVPVLRAGRPVVTYYGAPWCDPACKVH